MFSKELKEGTKKSHNAAENTKFVSQFLKGVLNQDEYAKLLSNFYYVYQTMEECVSAVATGWCVPGWCLWCGFL